MRQPLKFDSDRTLTNNSSFHIGGAVIFAVMKSGRLKYILIYCFAITLLFKTSGVVSVFANSIKTVEYSGNQDSTEKEEKKIETEYFEANISILRDLEVPLQLKEKVLLPQNNFFSSYFPEVLTPPPSSEA